LALIPVVVCYAILPEFIEIKFLDTLSPVTFFSAGLGYLGVVGINGQTLGDYVSDWLSYRKNKRKTYYNPRIKKEAVFFLDEQKQDKEMLPREKIMALYSKYKAHSDLKNRELAHELEKEFEQSEELYFEDDDEVEEFKIVTTVRGNSLKNLVSTESPIGKALLGHKVGDRVWIEINANAGYFVEIKSIRAAAPDEEEQLRKF
jgi:hypothetical protein